MDFNTALIVGSGPGLSASLARLFAKHGLQVALASREPDKLAKLAEETAGVTFACEATEPEEVAALFEVVVATQGVPDIVVYNASARARGPVTDLIPEDVARSIVGQRLWRVPGGAAGGAAHGGARVGGDLADRGVGEREGLSELVRLRDGQVRAARSGVEPGAGVVAEGRACGAFRHRRRDPQRAPGRIRTTIRTARWIRTRLRRRIGRSRTSRAARGRGRWNCGRGWRSSEAGATVSSSWDSGPRRD